MVASFIEMGQRFIIEVRRRHVPFEKRFGRFSHFYLTQVQNICTLCALEISYYCFKVYFPQNDHQLHELQRGCEISVNK